MDNEQTAITDPLQSRKILDHRGPLFVDVSNAIYFVTIAAKERSGSAFVAQTDAILDSARHYQKLGKWFVYLLLVMPDHLHMLVHVPTVKRLADVIAEWKHFLSRTAQLTFQRDFFDTRIRDKAHYAEKWKYICMNPVTRGLVATPREWPHSIAFDRATGAERPHR